MVVLGQGGSKAQGIHLQGYAGNKLYIFSASALDPFNFMRIQIVDPHWGKKLISFGFTEFLLTIVPFRLFLF